MIVGPLAAAPGILILTVQNYSQNPTRAIVIAIASFVIAFTAAAYVAFTWLPRYSDRLCEPEE
jgi:hypothetical protein